jgi:regulator of nucleoside diphosphate kinase
MVTTDLLVSATDYARLRALAAGHPLAEELDRAIVVPQDRVPEDLITMHSRLVYVDETAGMRREVELVYPEEANATAGRVSILAPVGSALLGLSAGDTIDWEFPGGETRRLRVERVLQPRASGHPPAAGPRA